MTSLCGAGSNFPNTLAAHTNNITNCSGSVLSGHSEVLAAAAILEAGRKNLNQAAAPVLTSCLCESSDAKSSLLIDSCATDLNAQTQSFMNTGMQLHNHGQQVTASSSTSQQLLLNGLSIGQTVNDQQSLSEDPRTLQLAFELSMIGLQNAQTATSTASADAFHHQQLSQNRNNLFDKTNILSTCLINDNNNMSACGLSSAFGTTDVSSSTNAAIPNEERLKKSQNMTECVPVPSSEHVAEIVGRQGCKIKALRAKTNTYIKTPVRGEEPVFVVTGRKEDVAKAKREILSAAEHFSLIRATRKPSLDGSLASNSGCSNQSSGGSGGGGAGAVGAGGGFGKAPPPAPPNVQGQVTIQVRVPYRVVGLVVGPKGSTIKHIQQNTQTYIVTPSRDKDPIFEVTGLPENVQLARKQIETHIAVRTGNVNTAGSSSIVSTDSSNNSALMLPTDIRSATSTTTTVHTINSLSQMLNEDFSQDFLSLLYKNSINSSSSTFHYFENKSGVESSTADAMISTDCVGVDMSTPLLNNNLQLQQQQHHNLNNEYLKDNMMNPSNNTQLQHNGIFVQQQQQQHQQQQQQQQSVNRVINSATAVAVPSVVPASTSNVIVTRSCSSASSTASSKSTNNSAGSNSSRPELISIWKNLGDSVDIDEGIGESPSIWTLQSTANISMQSGQQQQQQQQCSPTTSVSPTDSLLADTAVTTSAAVSSNEFTLNQQPQQPLAMAATNNSAVAGIKNECLICNNQQVNSALVPCGHSILCFECANHICGTDATCPVCSQAAYHAVRMLV